MSAHLAEIACAAVHEAMQHFHKPKPTYTDPAVIKRWGEWLTPDQWEDKHTGRRGQ